MAKIIALSMSLFLYASTIVGQQSTNPDVTGLVPYGTYEGNDIDHIDMASGQVYINLPLYSVPQRGSLSLSFSANVTGASSYAANATCSASECTYKYTVSKIPQVLISLDQKVLLQNVNPSTNTIYPTSTTFKEAGLMDGYPYSDGYINLAYKHQIVDGRGGDHYLGYDPSTSYTTLRAVDGSGYLEKLSDASGYKDGATGPIYDSKGIEYQTSGITDPSGNHIAYNTTSLTDSVGRTINLPPDPTTATATSTSTCPNLNNVNQPVTSAYEWSLPGPNGGFENYTICYTSFYTLTNFLNNGGAGITRTSPGAANGPPTFDEYEEGSRYNVAIQSIVYPDGSAWSFEYDGTQDETTVSYGDLLKVHLPTGGIIGYTYSTYSTCVSSVEGYPKGDAPLPFEPYSRVVTGRTLTQLDGSTQSWTYGYDSSLKESPSVTVGFPNGNSTVHKFTGMMSSGTCSFVESEQDDYEGSPASGKLLKNTQKTYYIYSIPQTISLYQSSDQWVGGTASDYESATVGSLPAAQTALPHTVVTTTDGQSAAATTTTYNYDAGFTEVQPFCSLENSSNYASCSWSLTSRSASAVLGQLTSVTVSGPDGHGGTLTSTTAKTYKAFNSSGITNPTYYARNLLNFPLTVTISGSGGNSSTVTYGYDEANGSPSGVIGNLTSTAITGANGGSSSSGAVYNNNGMPTITTDNKGNRTTYIYGDPSAVQATQEVLPSVNGITETYTYSWDANTGKLLTSTDQNGVLTQYSYADPLGRLTLVDTGVGSSAESRTKYGYPNVNTLTVATDQKSLGDALLSRSKTLDGFGRVKSTIDPSGAIVDTTYDAVGNVQSVSNPYYTSSDTTYGITSYSYDALGRRLYQCNQNNASSSQISCTPQQGFIGMIPSGNTTTITNENGNQWIRTVDALGRLTEVMETNGTSSTASMETDYRYDSLGNILSVSQYGGPAGSAGSRSRSFTYDSLSRLITSTNPENGVITYYYLTSGSTCSGDPSLPCSKTDARSVVTTYSYDNLNRVLSKSYSGTASSSTTPNACYAYDAASGGVGLLTAEWTQSGACSASAPAAGSALTEKEILSYDPMGRIWNERQCVGSSCTSAIPTTPPCSSRGPYYLPYCYDLAGNLTWSSNGVSAMPGITTPLAVGYSFDSANRLNSITSSFVDTYHPSGLFSNPSYAAQGAIKSVTYGADLTLSRSYDNRLRVTGETDTGTVVKGAAPSAGTITITGSEQSQ